MDQIQIKHFLSQSQVKRLNKIMLDNLRINLSDLKRNTPIRLIGKRLNFYCYLLAMLRTTIDFTDFAYAQANTTLGESLDAMYQDVQDAIVHRTNQRFPWLHWNAPITKRIIVGKLYAKFEAVRKILLSQQSRELNQNAEKKS